MAKAFQFYRIKNPATADAFKFTEATEDLCLLLNDAFDVMNGRRWKERIHHGNWEEKKKHLTDLIDAINETEAHSLESKYNGKPFLSDTSLKAMRLTLTSAMELTEFLLNKCSYDFVLSGKFNQDCLEVTKKSYCNQNLILIKYFFSAFLV